MASGDRSVRDSSQDQDTRNRDAWIDRICDRFEDAWQAGHRPDISEFADGRGPDRLALLRELLRLDVEYRRRAGEQPTEAEYANRFPELVDWLHSFPPTGVGMTEAYQPAKATANDSTTGISQDDSSKRFRVVLVGEAGNSEPRDLTDQLRRRLRLFACLAVVSSLVDIAIKLILHGSEILSTIGPWTHRQQQIVTLTVLALFELLAVILLAARRSQPLSRLRLLEALVFTGIVLFFIENDVGTLREDWDAITAHWAAFSNAAALQYAVLIISYGVLIPNPWRRCAAAVVLIAASAYLASTIGFALAPQPAGIIAAYLGQLTIWLGVAGVVVVYGAYRIEILRDQAERGRELGQYRLRQLLGSGGMGKVYLAQHRLLRRACAIKIIHPERAGDSNNLTRFEREVQATATLTHPNTIQIYDYGRTEDGTFYYVMEHLHGLTLEETVKAHGPLHPARAVHLLRQLCSALGEAHAIGLLHRDIKPGNVMVCQRGGIHDVVKLLDFGLVLPLAKDGDGERLSLHGSISGTPAYMSPEQINASKNLDSRSDIYSLGALAYFALTGQSPFAGRTPVEMMAAHIYEQPQHLARHRPDVDADLEGIVLRCLAKDPAARFPDAESLENALAECRCAGQWSRKEAAAWWHSHKGPNGTTSPEGTTKVLA
jgi:hypothetical protein